MSLTAAELRAVYSVDERPLDRSLSGLGGKVKGAIGGAVGAAAGLFAFAQIGSGFMGLTGAASDLNETINKSSVIFGGNAAQIEQWAGGAAKNLGLSKQQALAAAAGFGDMFSQIGFAGDQSADMSKKVVQMAADLGSFNNLPTEDVAQRISAAFRGEYDSLQALIPNINAARVEQEAMAATGKKNATELTAQEKAAAVLAIVNKDGARAMGDFARTSDGAANAAKIATAEWNDQKAAVGQQLLPALTAMIGFVRTSVIPGIGALVGALTESAQWISANRTPILILASVIGAVLLPHLTRLAVQSVISWGTATAASIKASAASVAASYRMIAAWIAARVAALASFGQTIVIMALYAASSVSSAAAAAGAWIAAQARTVASLAATAAGFVVQGAVMLASMVATAAGVVAGWVMMGAQALLQAARMAAAWFIAMGPVGWVIAVVVGLVALIIANWDTVKRVTGQAWDWVSGKVSGAWRAVVDAVSSGVSSAVSWVQSLPGRAKDALGNIGSLLLGAGSDLIRGFINGIKNMAGNVANAAMDVAKGAVNGVKNFLGIHSPSTVFAALGENVGQGFVNGIAGMRPAVAAEMQALANYQAMQGLQVRRPAGVRLPGAGSRADSSAGASAGGYDALVKADTINIIEGTADDVARKLAVEARTR